MPLLRACPVCQGQERVPVGHMPSPTHPMHIIACKECGLVFVNPMFANAEKEAVSPAVRLLHRSRSAEHSAALALRHSLRRMHRCMPPLASYLKPGARVLEIGSGDGAMLQLLKELGAAPMGIDLDAAAAQATSRALDVPVLVGPFEEAVFPGKPFDAVVLVHIIEHFYDPVEVLRKVRRLLRPGGVVFLETPNILRPKVGPGRVFSFAHNYHFSPRTLALALHQAGFRATRLREFYRDSFQLVAHAAHPGELGPAPRGDSWQSVARLVQRHRFRYVSRLQFLWRKLPWLKDRLIYRVRRELSGPALQVWLTGSESNAAA